MESKLVKKTQIEFINLCEENLKLSNKINEIKKMVVSSENENVLMDIHKEEFQTLVETYINNSTIITENMFILGLLNDEVDFRLN